MTKIVNDVKEKLRERRRELLAELRSIDAMLSGKAKRRIAARVSWADVASNLGPVITPRLLADAGKGKLQVASVWLAQQCKAGKLVRIHRGLYRFPEAK